jgi:signal transduction histidine kinase
VGPRTLVQLVEALALALEDAEGQAAVAHAVLEANPDAIGLFGSDGEVLLENAPMAELRAALEASGWPAPFLDRRAGSAERREVELGDERQRTFSRFTAPVGDRTIVVMRDTTAEREAERAKDQFFALVSHELRTPVTSIAGFLEMILGEPGLPLAPEHERALRVIERNTGRLRRLVDDILFVSQVEARTAELRRLPVRLERLVGDAVESARPAAADAGVELASEVERDAAVLGDSDRLGQLLDNLTSNAIKFTPQGGRVAVRLRAGAGRARLEVSDSGVGIAAEDQERVWNAFFRAPTARQRQVPGVGLGLAVASSIARAHGGELRVHSAPGAGSTFSLELPEV